MCGILGCIQLDAHLPSMCFDTMLDTLVHRGPDGRGVQTLDGGRILLGHRRLAIIDLGPTGAQPMCNEDSTVWITFNGEIYNYRELRAELLALGHRFRSESDTEVIVHAWETWGKDCVHHLRGIFAFGIWDDRKKALFLARDQLGVKPLYYSRYAGRFTFASQPRAILADDAFARTVDATGLRDYFAFGYVPRERSAFSGMYKLPAGHWLYLENGQVNIHEYWRVEYQPSLSDRNEAITEIRHKLVEAVETQLVSDVPVGCFLSGGIDSSLLVALARRKIELRTFTIGFEETGSDERTYARDVANAFATTHYEEVLKRPRIQTALHDVTEYYDEPFNPSGPMPFMEVARLARQHETIVALGGDGADELFMGYLRYDDFDRPHQLSGPYGKRFWNWLRHAGLLGCRNLAADDLERYFHYEGVCNDHEQSNFLTREFACQARGNVLDTLRPYFQPGLPALVAAQLADMNHYLVDHILSKVDRAAMAHSVEARVPFLDIELVKAAFTIPVTINYAKAKRKSLLKRAARSFLSQSTITSRKKGFSSPLATWLDPELRTWGNHLINDGALIGHGILRPDWAQWLEDGLKTTRVHFRAWWLILAAELWCRRWIEGDTTAVASHV